MISGRRTIWKFAINTIKNNKIIFGVGPQGDRQIFEKFKKEKNSELNYRFIKWSTNVSNGLLYSYLSGGILSAFLIIFTYILVIKEVFVAIFKNKLFYKNYNQEIVSIFCLIYLCFRSLYENSFTVFGTDFIIFVITYYNIYQFNQNLKY